MFLCSLCQEETCYISAFCPDCTRFKRLVNVYGRKETLQILEKVCLRNQKQREYKITDVKKNLSDSVYVDNGIKQNSTRKSASTH